MVAGERFLTAGGFAQVVERQAAGNTSEDDVLMLEVTTFEGRYFRAWTTIIALESAVESGGWRLPGHEDRLAA